MTLPAGTFVLPNVVPSTRRVAVQSVKPGTGRQRPGERHPGRAAGREPGVPEGQQRRSGSWWRPHREPGDLEGGSRQGRGSASDAAAIHLRRRRSPQAPALRRTRRSFPRPRPWAMPTSDGRPHDPRRAGARDLRPGAGRDRHRDRRRPAAGPDDRRVGAAGPDRDGPPARGGLGATWRLARGPSARTARCPSRPPPARRGSSLVDPNQLRALVKGKTRGGGRGGAVEVRGRPRRPVAGLGLDGDRDRHAALGLDRRWHLRPEPHCHPSSHANPAAGVSTAVDGAVPGTRQRGAVERCRGAAARSVTRLLGLDLGERRIGVAVADDDGMAHCRSRPSAGTRTRRRDAGDPGGA